MVIDDAYEYQSATIVSYGRKRENIRYKKPTTIGWLKIIQLWN
jgi:hypothetical protein